jgi:hypothetical protein
MQKISEGQGSRTLKTRLTFDLRKDQAKLNIPQGQLASFRA